MSANVSRGEEGRIVVDEMAEKKQMIRELTQVKDEWEQELFLKGFDVGFTRDGKLTLKNELFPTKKLLPEELAAGLEAIETIGDILRRYGATEIPEELLPKEQLKN